MNEITKTLCPEHKRLGFLPKFTGKKSMAYENALYKAMSHYCSDYTGGYWNFYNLSNGGFYTALDTHDSLKLQNIGNYYQGTMSTDAAGIAVNLMVQNAFAWQENSVYFSDIFYFLRDYASQHHERDHILQFID